MVWASILFSGEAIKGRREKFTIATKFGIKVVDGQFGLDSSRPYVRAACEASLKRLGIDCIDLYYQHRIDPSTPIEETMLELKVCLISGKEFFCLFLERIAWSVSPPNEVLDLSVLYCAKVL